MWISTTDRLDRNEGNSKLVSPKTATFVNTATSRMHKLTSKNNAGSKPSFNKTSSLFLSQGKSIAVHPSAREDVVAQMGQQILQGVVFV